MVRPASACLIASVALSLPIATACRLSPDVGSHPQIHLHVPSDNPAAAFVEVTGLSGRDLKAVRAGNLSDDGWTALLRVTVEREAATASARSASVPEGGKREARDEDDVPAMLGVYSIQDDNIRFTPRFPLDAGRPYKVVFDASRLPDATAGTQSALLVAIVSRPKAADAPSTRVSQVYPTTDLVPENQLRLYIHFSAPMGRRNGVDFVRLIDEKGKEVEAPFLPLDADLWNDDRTRYTVFFDPGRVKQDLLPRRQMGPSLEAGHRYTLVIDAAWPDAKGLPLTETYRRPFRVGPPDERPIDPQRWMVAPPAAGTRDPVVVTFPEPLDRGLLLRAVGIARGGTALDGEVRIETNETKWLFTPRDPWRAGEYQLVALSILEDLAGNRIGQRFEVDEFERVDASPQPERFTVPFRVGSVYTRSSNP
jgi:hypothetical protein